MIHGQTVSVCKMEPGVLARISQELEAAPSHHGLTYTYTFIYLHMSQAPSLQTSASLLKSPLVL